MQTKRRQNIFQGVVSERTGRNLSDTLPLLLIFTFLIGSESQLDFVFTSKIGGLFKYMRMIYKQQRYTVDRPTLKTSR